MNDQDRAELADLAMRALDTIAEEYGEHAELEAACLVFEVRIEGDDGESFYHGNYKSLERNSPHHIAGLLYTTGQYLMTPEAEE